MCCFRKHTPKPITYNFRTEKNFALAWNNITFEVLSEIGVFWFKQVLLELLPKSRQKHLEPEFSSKKELFRFQMTVAQYCLILNRFWIWTYKIEPVWLSGDTNSHFWNRTYFWIWTCRTERIWFTGHKNSYFQNLTNQ